ncbi:MAG: hypothetical protein AAF667_16905 [Pseudomonadota bacterium]
MRSASRVTGLGRWTIPFALILATAADGQSSEQTDAARWADLQVCFVQEYAKRTEFTILRLWEKETVLAARLGGLADGYLLQANLGWSPTWVARVDLSQTTVRAFETYQNGSGSVHRRKIPPFVIWAMEACGIDFMGPPPSEIDLGEARAVEVRQIIDPENLATRRDQTLVPPLRP